MTRTLVALVIGLFFAAGAYAVDDIGPPNYAWEPLAHGYGIKISYAPKQTFFNGPFGYGWLKTVISGPGKKAAEMRFDLIYFDCSNPDPTFFTHAQALVYHDVGFPDKTYDDDTTSLILKGSAPAALLPKVCARYKSR